MDTRADELRRWVEARIEERGTSQRQVSLRAGMSESTLKQFLSGRTQRLRYDHARGVARALDLPSREVLAMLGYPDTEVGADFVTVPLASVRVAAGMDIWEPTGNDLTIERDASHGRDLVAMTVMGDCMVPDVLPGDVILVDRNNRLPSVGDLVVLAGESGPMLKRYDIADGQPILRDSKGGAYRPNGARLVGVVFEVRRRLRRTG